jgi:hypothetical protein
LQRRGDGFSRRSELAPWLGLCDGIAEAASPFRAKPSGRPDDRTFLPAFGVFALGRLRILGGLLVHIRNCDLLGVET